jgi:hypothetical protein
MVLLSLVWQKEIILVSVAGVNKVVLSYTFMINVIKNICVQTINRTIVIFIPSGENGNLSAYFCNTSLKTIVSCNESGHLATTKVNLISKSHTTITFWAI